MYNQGLNKGIELRGNVKAMLRKKRVGKYAEAKCKIQGRFKI